MSAGQGEAVKSGYAFSTPAVELGALVVEGGTADPQSPIRVPLSMLNRHGLVAGATGTGKTKTLQVMAEQLSAAGVPVFLADIKGDVSGMAVAGEPNDKITSRMRELGQQWAPTAYPAEFFTLGGRGTGTPIRATVTAFGPILIRSKGVGVFFVTQTPKDVHPDVLAQLGNRIQHALRAYTPDDAKALKATASTFPKSAYDLEEVLTQLGTGEAVVTVLNEKGAPTPVAWTRLRAPQSLMAEAPATVLEQATKNSPLFSRYATAVDRESAYEMLVSRLNPQATTPEQAGYPQGDPQAPSLPPPPPAPSPKPTKAAKPEPGMVEQVLGSRTTQNLIKSAAAAAGTAIVRSIFGTARREKK